VRVTIKIGSNILAGGHDGLNLRRMRSLAASIAKVRGMGHEVIVVSSGAVAAGRKRLGLAERPREVKLKQAAAAVGQPALMWRYDQCFREHGTVVAQVLLTRDGLSNRTMYLNSKNTIQTLLGFGVVPIINENDTVATDEIKFGDNDQLAALVASLTECDRLIILSDVDGLYSSDPRRDPGASIVERVTEVTPEMFAMAGGEGSAVGTGGMYSKLLAARNAMRSGIRVTIMSGHRPARLVSAMKGRAHGTEFVPGPVRLPARKGWIAFGIRPSGTIVLDEGAVRAVGTGGRSLLPSGITAVEGTFPSGAAVYLADGRGGRFARGLSNYSSDEIGRIKGRKTSEIEATLGYKYSDEVVHCDNLVLVGEGG
jgi:glutamate 5-kinase